ncbi:MAG: hypothetical protein KatS3mg115_1891 [Candidatus Poribacteria bacterium]|nr:MAG: hypothetical protein KatS3mg115_1891 [Candidatus Poribacteria bacterium]
MIEPLDPDAIQAALPTKRLGRRVFAFGRTPSTQDVAREAARSEPDPDGLLVIAEYQTAGRGRLGRRWFSGVGQNLLFSLVLCPERPAPGSLMDHRGDGDRRRRDALGAGRSLLPSEMA